MGVRIGGVWHEDLPESIGRKEKGGSKFSCDTDTNRHMEISSEKLKSGEKTGRLEGRKALGR